MTIEVFAATPLQTIAFSEPLPVNLKVYRGDSGRLRITVKKPDNTPLDITAATWDCDIRLTQDTVSSVASMTAIPVDGDESSVDIHLPASESIKLTGPTYFYDVEMTLNSEVQTLIAGTVTVTKDVSRTP